MLDTELFCKIFKLCAFNVMTNTLSRSLSDVFISILAILSHIFHFGCHVRHVRMALLKLVVKSIQKMAVYSS